MKRASFRYFILLTVLLFPVTAAFANSMQVSIVRWLFIPVGIAGIVLSAALGFAGFYVAVKVRLDTSARVLARGFLGVSSVLCFALSGSLIVFALNDMPWVGNLILICSLIFFSVEFAVAGSLYRRVHAKNSSAWAKVLSVTSFAVCVILGVSAVINIAVVIFGANFRGLPVGELVLMAAACAIIGFGVMKIVKNGLPSTTGQVMGNLMPGLGALFIAIIGAGMLKDGSPGSYNIILGIAVALLEIQLIFTGWLFWRLAHTGKKWMKAIAVLCYAIGGLMLLLGIFSLAAGK